MDYHLIHEYLTLRAEGGRAVWAAEGLSSGMYFSRVANGAGVSSFLKLILMK